DPRQARRRSLPGLKEKDMAAQPKTIIEDMRSPRLTPLQAEALAAAAANPVTITPETVLEAARAETGLSDFGDPGFRIRLKLWCDAVNAERDLTHLARAGTYADMVRFAANRLRVEDAIRRHPEILSIEIDRPLIVAGLPRSGTTYLQN